MNKYLLILSALVVTIFSINSEIRNVPAQYTTIQAAINGAVNGDTVLVAPGTYFENINFRGKNIVVTGTYFQSGNPQLISSTIINGSTPSHIDTASCVIIANHEDSTTVLQGFTLTGGKGTLWDDEHSPGNRFREGGGLLIQYSSPTIQNNIIHNNEAINNTGGVSAGGGGIRMGDSNPKVFNNIIMFNKGLYGPGVVLNYSGGTFKNNIVIQNSGATSFGGGGAFWILGTSPGTSRILENNTILNNSAVAGTGGVLCLSSVIIIRNNIIRSNTSSQIQISGGSVTATYNNIQGGYTGAGNISDDPLFADSNYILQNSSPCVDKGDSSMQYNDVADPNNGTLAKYPSRGGLRNDIGAYGGQLVKLLTNQLIAVNNIGSEIPGSFSLYQNYPNPFNPATQIIFDLRESGKTKLAIYDILGREVTVLVNEFKSAGRYTAIFNADALSSGIYFYTLQSGKFNITKKMILNK